MNDILIINKTMEHQITQSINELKKEIQIGLRKLTKIESYLYDDDETKSPGMVQKQRDHELRLTKLENESMERKKIWATLGFVAGIVGTALIEFIKWLFTHNPK